VSTIVTKAANLQRLVREMLFERREQVMNAASLALDLFSLLLWLKLKKYYASNVLGRMYFWQFLCGAPNEKSAMF